VVRRSARPAGRSARGREVRADRQLADLYATYRLDGDAITEAVAELLLSA
jgi:hypothetical protein